MRASRVVFVLPQLWAVLHGELVLNHGSRFGRVLNHGVLECFGCAAVHGASVGGSLFDWWAGRRSRFAHFIPGRIGDF